MKTLLFAFWPFQNRSIDLKGKLSYKHMTSEINP